ncbi:hypothetical protein K7X08_003704 [Anisodus acutangulus]|uniref:Uncharacterized protein n=1 Tax=Anisodus acutangulus TaxID=402998 RepID=A0A9Q1MG53_9SOLA|nr:hypothetical protein K7X08_003704 [Anisodus acutangulus]
MLGERTAIGLDLDVEALDWCMENNVNKVDADVSSRIFLFHGNVLQPLEAKLLLLPSYSPRTSFILKHALSALNKKGGIFVMDLYGGTSGEHELRMQRKFPNFADNSEHCYNEFFQCGHVNSGDADTLLCIFRH